MSDLRSEIRASFEKEQAEHPPVQSLRQTLVDAATMQPRQVASSHWLVVVAAILIATIVVTGLVASRLYRTPSPSHVPPVGDYGPPPAGVPLIYVADSSHEGWYIGFDWSGKARGTVKVARPLDRFQRLFQAPDGSGFRITDRSERSYIQGDGFAERLGGPTGDFVDLGGTVVTGILPAAGTRGIWADDSRHLCLGYVDPQTGDWTLATMLAGQSAKTVTAIPHGYAAYLESANRVASCSFKRDRAILVRALYGLPTELWLVRISDGKFLEHHLYAVNQFDSLVASGDGTYIAENGRSSNGTRTNPTQIRRVSDWTVIASWTTEADVMGFSGDGSLVVLSGRPVEVMEWRSQSVLWRASWGQGLVGLLAQPNGRGIAVAFEPPMDVSLAPICADPSPPVTCHPTAFFITIVHGDGTATQLPGLGTAW
jgi:hypothetical protein